MKCRRRERDFEFLAKFMRISIRTRESSLEVLQEWRERTDWRKTGEKSKERKPESCEKGIGNEKKGCEILNEFECEESYKTEYARPMNERDRLEGLC